MSYVNDMDVITGGIDPRNLRNLNVFKKAIIPERFLEPVDSENLNCSYSKIGPTINATVLE